MRYLMAPAGTRGDMQPCLALAVALQRAGHQVTFCAFPNYEQEVRSFGIAEFQPAGMDLMVFISENQHRFRKVTPRQALRVLHEQLEPELDKHFAALVPLARRAD